MKKNTVLLMILIFCATLYAEDKPRMNSISIDFCAPGSFITASYDRYFFRSGMHALSANIGIGTLLTIISFPVGIDYSFGQRHQLLMGAHYFPVISISDRISEKYTTFMSLKFGYRYNFQIFKNCPMFFQAYLSPAFSVFDFDSLLFATVGVGFNF